MLEVPEPEAAADGELDEGVDADRAPLLERAIDVVVQTQTASVSLLQRRLRVGYTRAGRLIDMLERRGIISGYEGSKPRRVLVGEGELDRLARIADQSGGPPVYTRHVQDALSIRAARAEPNDRRTRLRLRRGDPGAGDARRSRSGRVLVDGRPHPRRSRVPAAVILGLVAMSLSRSARRHSQISLGRIGGTGVAPRRLDSRAARSLPGRDGGVVGRVLRLAPPVRLT